MKGFLDYIAGDSILHRLNPLTKLLLSLLMCVSCFISNNHIFIVGLIIVIIGFSYYAKIVNRTFILLRGLVKLSILLFIVQVFFVRSGTIIVMLPLNIYITNDGVLFSLLIVLKLIGATLPLALMLSVTKMNDLANVLVYRLFIPYKYAFAFTTAIRFIPLFANEMAGIMEAQTSRGVKFDTRNIFKKISLILPLCVPLLITSVKKIESTAISAQLRGFNYRTRKSGFKHQNMKWFDWITILFSLLLIISVSIYF